jgi:antitoxin component of MazEF toxin-antitoxin module
LLFDAGAAMLPAVALKYLDLSAGSRLNCAIQCNLSFRYDRRQKKNDALAAHLAPSPPPVMQNRRRRGAVRSGGWWTMADAMRRSLGKR